MLLIWSLLNIELRLNGDENEFIVTRTSFDSEVFWKLESEQDSKMDFLSIVSISTALVVKMLSTQKTRRGGERAQTEQSLISKMVNKSK